MTTGRHRLRQALPLCLAVTLLLPARLHAQQPHDPPAVKVHFDLSEAPLYRDLPGRALLEQEMAGYLADKCRRVNTFGFVRWIPASDATVPAEEVKASLTLKLVQRDEQIGNYPASEILMKLSAEILGRALTDFGVEKTLYGLTELDKNSQNPDKLKQRIRSRIDEWFDAAGAEDFQNALMNRFLNNVPLSDNVQIDEENYLIIIPLRVQEEDLHENASVLRATFTARKDGTAFDGRFTAEVKGPYTPPGSTDKVLYCMLQTFYYPYTFYYQYPPLDLSNPTPEALHNTYGRDIKEILSESRRASLTVYMDRYRTYTDVLADHQ